MEQNSIALQAEKSTRNLGPNADGPDESRLCLLDAVQLTERRAKELGKAESRLLAQDKRSLSAWQRSFSRAEAFATTDFQNTVLFKPFCGSFVVTRLASKEFGWTNSQPVDLINGYEAIGFPGAE